jgi:hypothetical protein
VVDHGTGPVIVDPITAPMRASTTVSMKTKASTVRLLTSCPKTVVMAVNAVSKLAEGGRGCTGECM